MELSEDYHQLLLRKSATGKLIFWSLAVVMLFFVFTNRTYDLGIRIVLVTLLLLMSLGVSQVINRVLIHRFLFRGKIGLFAYLLLFTLVVSFWLTFLVLILILLYSGYYMPQLVVPQPADITLLLSGTYLIVLLSAILHFVKETYRRQVEKQEAVQRHKEVESKLKEARIELLQGQLHPHFLFNMLNNLYGLIEESPGRSKEMILDLSEMLDFILYKCNRQTIRLTEELDFIRRFVRLEQSRRAYKLPLTLQLPDRMPSLSIAPLLLFPFVENAFKHGNFHEKGAFIKISLEVENSHLYFCVENSVGDDLTENRHTKTAGGIGLPNIRERLQLLYPASHQLKVISQKQYLVELSLNTDIYG